MKYLYFCYLVHFLENAPTFVSHPHAKDHLSLLRLARLADAFHRKPRSFVMGRFVYQDDQIVIDTASDLYLGKTGIERPLEAGVDKREFERCLWEEFGNDCASIFVLNMGFRLRVSSLTRKRLDTLLKRSRSGDRSSNFYQVTRPPS